VLSGVGFSLRQRKKTAVLQVLGLVVEIVLLMRRANNAATVFSSCEAQRVANCGAG
jgi:cell division inhibitor SulA